MRGVKALAYAMRTSPTLRSVNLSGNYLCGAKAGKESFVREGIEAVARAVLESSVLTDLSVSGNRLGDDGAIALAAGVKASSSLASIDLSDNNISIKGAKAIGSAMLDGRLATVNLRGNVLDAAAAAPLSRAIAESTHLTDLNLSNNFLRADGARVIAEAVRPVNSVPGMHHRHCTRRGQPLHQKTCRYPRSVAQMVKSKSLRNMNLASNSMAEGVEPFASAIMKSNVAHLDVRHNGTMPPHVKKALKDVGNRSKQKHVILL